MVDSNKDQRHTGSNPVTFDQQSHTQWQTLAEKSLKGQSLEALSHITASNLAIDPLYTDRPKSKNAIDPTPLKRWDNRLCVLGNTAAEQNANVLSGLAGGVSSLQLTLGTQAGGQVNSNDLSIALKGVQLEIVPISLLSGNQFAASAALMESVLKDAGIAASDVSLAFNADPIGYIATTDNQSAHLQTLMRALNQLAIYTHENLPNSSAVCVNASCYHNAGGSIEHELIAAVATATIYLQSMLDEGMDAQLAHNSMVFQIACDADVLSNVVKLRVLKSLWYHVAGKMGVKKPHCQLVVESSKRMQSLMEPWVNHLRNVSCATAAAMGGAQSILIHPHNYIDNQFIDADIELSARVARNIPIIISEESSLTFVHDPMAGAYSVETLSATLSDSCWQGLQRLEQNGGLVDALISGQYQADIAKHQQQRVERLQSETDIQVGVNRYVNASSKSQATTSATDSTLTANALLTKRDAQSFEGIS